MSRIWQTKTIGTALLAGVVLTCSAAAQAQTPAANKVFLDFSVGIQALSGTLETNATFPLFGETASVIATQEVGIAPLLDGRIGFRMLPRFAIAFAVSGIRDRADAEAVATVPSPIFVGSPTMVTLQGQGLTRREVGYHVQVAWLNMLSDKVELSIFGGPSFIYLQQHVMTAAPGGPEGVTASTRNDTGTGIGGNGGVDLVYLVSNRAGVGLLVRYVIGSVDLESTSGVRVGGLHTAGGVRFRF
jgi:hypothetical protein